MNTSLPIRKATAIAAAHFLARGAAIQLGTLLVAGILTLATRPDLSTALSLGPVPLAAQAAVGLGTGAALAGGIAFTALASSWGWELAPARTGLAGLLITGLLGGLCAGMLFHVALQPLVGVLAAGALFALLELLSRQFPLFGTARPGSALLALALGIAFGLLYQRFGLAAALVAHAGFRVIFLALTQPALAQRRI